MIDQGLSAQTVLHTQRLLHKAPGSAVKGGLVGRNVCDATEPPRAQRKEMVSLDIDGVARLLAVAEESPYRDVFFIAIYTGLRRFELLALRWPDIDLEWDPVSVTAALHNIPGKGIILLPTKT
jgi:integrase